MNSDIFARSVSDNTAESQVELTPDEIKAALIEREQFRVENALLRMAIGKAGGKNHTLDLFLEEIHVLAIEQSPAIRELVKDDILLPINGSQMSEEEFALRLQAIRDGNQTDAYKARHAALFPTVELTPVDPRKVDEAPEKPYRNAREAVEHLAEIGKS